MLANVQERGWTWRTILVPAIVWPATSVGVVATLCALGQSREFPFAYVAMLQVFQPIAFYVAFEARGRANRAAAAIDGAARAAVCGFIVILCVSPFFCFLGVLVLPLPLIGLPAGAAIGALAFDARR